MTRQSRFNLSTGVVELSFPMPMTPDDVQDFEDAMAILFRMLRRTATNGQPEDRETASGDNIARFVGPRNQQTPGA
jgi:hypothetical protein